MSDENVFRRLDDRELPFGDLFLAGIQSDGPDSGNKICLPYPLKPVILSFAVSGEIVFFARIPVGKAERIIEDDLLVVKLIDHEWSRGRGKQDSPFGASI